MNLPKPHKSVTQEEDTLPPRLILYAILGVLVFSFVLGLTSWLIQRWRFAELRPSGQFPETQLGPIRERSNVHEELYTELGVGQLLLREQSAALDKFGWVDQQRRIVSLPIDVAMDLVLNEANP